MSKAIMSAGSVVKILITKESVSPSQGVHEAGGPSLEYYQLERLVELVVSPYLGNVLHNRSQLLFGQWAAIRWLRDILGSSSALRSAPAPDVQTGLEMSGGARLLQDSA